ncbi:MAG: TIGR04211 family SH3 domain-containing protein [Succinivibrio sp.]
MRTLLRICAISLAFSSACAFATEQNGSENADANTSEPIKIERPSSIEDVQVGDEIYVSEAANVWLRTCPSSNCRISAATHVGDTFKFVKMSEDKKFVLVDDGNRQLWMQTRDLQTEPCGKAKVALLEGEVAKLKNDLENYDSIVAKDFHAAKNKLEKLEAENARLKEVLSKQNEQIEDLDATRRDYADKLETKELDMQMRWWLQGAVIAFCGAIIGIICVYIPRPNKKRRQVRF